MNTYFTVICLSAFAAVTSAYPPVPMPLVPVAAYEERVPNYNFNYAVNDPSTGDNKAQWEARDGDVVHGAYKLVEPDGNIRLVEYTADALHGFNAVVKRTGPQIHPITPVMTKVAAPIAPIAHLAPVAQVGHVEHTASVAPIVEHFADVTPAHIAPVITPVIETAPVVHQEILPMMPVHSSPWVTLSGTTYGHKGIVRRWAAGPISLDGKTLTIRTKHH